MDKLENQIVSKNLPVGMQKLFLDPKTADVFFKIHTDGMNQPDDVPAHKFPLAAVSDVFFAMFYGELKENRDVIIVDASKAAFEEFLQFFYHRKVTLTMKNVAKVMYLADKYNVQDGITICVQFLWTNLTSNDVFTGLSLGDLYNNTQLKTFCENYIALNARDVLNSTEFLDCDKKTLEIILKMDSLSCSETKLFEACMSWVKARSKRDMVTKKMVRMHLGDLFYEFRFTSMEYNDFDALYLSNRTAFSPDEFEDIIRTFTPTASVPRLFNHNPRRNTAIECDREDPNTVEIAFKLPDKHLSQTPRSTFMEIV